MILALAATVAVLFGAGATLMLSRDLFRMVTGAVLASNAVTLFLVAAGLSPLTAGLRPLTGAPEADPLVQALALTAIVITFGVASLLLALVIRAYTRHGTIDLDDLAEAERAEELDAGEAAAAETAEGAGDPEATEREAAR